MIHWKDERRIRPGLDQSQISARLDGSLIVDPYFRPQWLPNFSNIRAHCGIRSDLQKPGMKSRCVCALGCSVFRGSDRFAVTKSVQKGRGISLSRRHLPVISAFVAIRQTQGARDIGFLFREAPLLLLRPRVVALVTVSATVRAGPKEPEK
jgi:hypothetical protein